MQMLMDFFATPFGVLILTVLKALALLVPLLIGVAYLTYAERKVLGAMQLRRGRRTCSLRSRPMLGIRTLA